MNWNNKEEQKSHQFLGYYQSMKVVKPDLRTKKNNYKGHHFSRSVYFLISLRTVYAEELSERIKMRRPLQGILEQA